MHPKAEITRVCNAEDMIGDDWRESFMLQSENVSRYIDDPKHGSRKLLKGPFPILKAQIQKHCARSVLDVGCNLGYTYDWLKYAGIDIEYTGIDINPDMIAEAEKRHTQPGPVFDVADLFTMGQGYAADVVFCSRVLIHLPDFQEAVRKLHALAHRSLVLVLLVDGVESCTRYRTTDSFYYLRAVTPAMLKATGLKHTVHPHGRYSVVVFDDAVQA
jgi:trans-aconitate methyltransferase